MEIHGNMVFVYIEFLSRQRHILFYGGHGILVYSSIATHTQALGAWIHYEAI